MDIIIFGGQSNMQGQTECLSETCAVPGAFEYKWLDNKLEPLKNPVGENIRYDGSRGLEIIEDAEAIGKWLPEHGLGAACFGHTNLVPAFCRAYLQTKHGKAEYTAGNAVDKEAQVVAVHAAKGSTKITDWLPGTPGYALLKGKGKAAIDLVQSQAGEAMVALDRACSNARAVGVEHIYFVWLQGESDAIASVSKEQYKAHLRTLSAALQADLQIEKFGIIRVGRFTMDDRDWEIIHAQSEICREEPGFVMLTEIATELNEQSVYMNSEYHGHYSAAGAERLGAAAGKALADFARRCSL